MPAITTSRASSNSSWVTWSSLTCRTRTNWRVLSARLATGANSLRSSRVSPSRFLTGSSSSAPYWSTNTTGSAATTGTAKHRSSSAGRLSGVSDTLTGTDSDLPGSG